MESPSTVIPAGAGGEFDGGGVEGEGRGLRGEADDDGEADR
jgi:hypothetical protein